MLKVANAAAAEVVVVLLSDGVAVVEVAEVLGVIERVNNTEVLKEIDTTGVLEATFEDSVGVMLRLLLWRPQGPVTARELAAVRLWPKAITHIARQAGGRGEQVTEKKL